jgi:Trk-type K+ transport system membrane component
LPAGETALEDTRSMAPVKKKSRIRLWLGLPEALLVISFGGAIILGALLLRLPWAQQAGRVNFLDALFTSTSAVCGSGPRVGRSVSRALGD